MMSSPSRDDFMTMDAPEHLQQQYSSSSLTNHSNNGPGGSKMHHSSSTNAIANEQQNGNISGSRRRHTRQDSSCSAAEADLFPQEYSSFDIATNRGSNSLSSSSSSSITNHPKLDYILSLVKEMCLFFFLWHPFRERGTGAGVVTRQQQGNSGASGTSSSSAAAAANKMMSFGSMMQAAHSKKDLDMMASTTASNSNNNNRPPVSSSLASSSSAAAASDEYNGMTDPAAASVSNSNKKLMSSFGVPSLRISTDHAPNGIQNVTNTTPIAGSGMVSNLDWDSMQIEESLQRTRGLDSMFSLRSIVAGILFMFLFLLIPLSFHFGYTRLFHKLVYPLRVQVLYLKLLFKIDVSRLLLACMARSVAFVTRAKDDNMWHHASWSSSTPLHGGILETPAPSTRQWTDFLLFSKETAPNPMKLEDELYYRDLDLDSIVIGGSRDYYGVYGWIHSSTHASALDDDDFFVENYREEGFDSDSLFWKNNRLGMHRVLPPYLEYIDFYNHLFTWHDLYMSMKASVSVSCIMLIHLAMTYGMMRCMRKNWKKSRKVGSYKIVAQDSSPLPSTQLKQLSSQTPSHAGATPMFSTHSRSNSYSHSRNSSLDLGDQKGFLSSLPHHMGGSQQSLLSFNSTASTPDSFYPPSVTSFHPVGMVMSGSGAVGHNRTASGGSYDPWQFPNFEYSATNRRQKIGSHQDSYSHNYDPSSPSSPAGPMFSHQSGEGMDSAPSSPTATTPDTQQSLLSSAPFTSGMSSFMARRPGRSHQHSSSMRKKKTLFHYLHVASRYYLGNIYLAFFGLLHILPVLFCMNEYSFISARLILIMTGLLFITISIVSAVYCSEARNQMVLLHTFRWISVVVMFVYCQFEVRQLFVRFMVDSGQGFSDGTVIQEVLGVPMALYGFLISLANCVSFVVFLRYSAEQLDRCALANSNGSNHFSPLLRL